MARGLVFMAAIAGAGIAFAQPKPVEPKSPVIGASALIKLTTPTGFIDDVVAADGQRLAYVVADTASKAELHVVTLATKQEQVIDIAPVTLHPVGLHLVGARALIVGRTEDGKQLAALIELTEKAKRKPAGTIVYKLAPADHITPISREGKTRIAVHRTSSTKSGVRHELELVALETGRRIGAKRSLELDSAGTSKQLDFRVNHWSEGWTHAHGIKGGVWDRKENQRSPDLEAAYDLLTGKFHKKGVEDLFEQKRRFQTLADANGTIDFVRASWDNLGLQLWRAGQPRILELDQPFSIYDPKSLQGVITSDGSAWLVLKVDPVNPDAVARKKADTEYLDVFRAPADGKATRKARVLAHGVRHRFGVVGENFWLIERNQGFERGGKSLTLYQLQ